MKLRNVELKVGILRLKTATERDWQQNREYEIDLRRKCIIRPISVARSARDEIINYWHDLIRNGACRCVNCLPPRRKYHNAYRR